MSQVDLGERLVAILERHPAVRSAAIVGSRDRGDPTALSDWDVEVDPIDFDRLAHDLPRMFDELEPLGHQWDPLSDRWNYMLMLPGPVKVDLIFQLPFEHQPPREASAETLPLIEHHFWDWTLWLASKQLRGKQDLVRDELRKMSGHLLAPLGVDRVPADIGEAIELFVDARTRAEARLGARVDREMQTEVPAAIERALGASPREPRTDSPRPP